MKAAVFTNYTAAGFRIGDVTNVWCHINLKFLETASISPLTEHFFRDVNIMRFLGWRGSCCTNGSFTIIPDLYKHRVPTFTLVIVPTAPVQLIPALAFTFHTDQDGLEFPALRRTRRIRQTAHRLAGAVYFWCVIGC